MDEGLEFESDAQAVVLVCAVELCSLHFQYGRDPQHMVANALFADGAAALVGVAGGGTSSDQTAGWQVAASGSCIVPDSEKTDRFYLCNSHGIFKTSDNGKSYKLVKSAKD